jgi:DNA-binding helix-hairpin-helix protein with protein kinase domain
MGLFLRGHVGPLGWVVPLTRRRRQRMSNGAALAIVLSIIGICFVIPAILVVVGMLSELGR